MECYLFLPQMRMSFEQIVERARTAEAAGFDGMAGMDHLAPPGAVEQPMYEALTTNTWIAAHTEQLKVSSLVQCDAMRHPAVLAKQAISLDHASGGRFELALGWGSSAWELEAFGIDSGEAGPRIRRLRETLEVLRALWTGETVNYEGEFHRLRGARQAPLPLGHIPIVIGGSGPRTLKLVAEYADWWNLLPRALDRLEELTPRIGKARISLQQMVAYVTSETERSTIVEQAERRFPGFDNIMTGNAEELQERIEALRARGVERIYFWFTDFARPATLEHFGREVIRPLKNSR